MKIMKNDFGYCITEFDKDGNEDQLIQIISCFFGEHRTVVFGVTKGLLEFVESDKSKKSKMIYFDAANFIEDRIVHKNIGKLFDANIQENIELFWFEVCNYGDISKAIFLENLFIAGVLDEDLEKCYFQIRNTEGIDSSYSLFIYVKDNEFFVKNILPRIMEILNEGRQHQ